MLGRKTELENKRKEAVIFEILKKNPNAKMVDGKRLDKMLTVLVDIKFTELQELQRSLTKKVRKLISQNK